MRPSCPREQTDAQAPPDKLLYPANWDRICPWFAWFVNPRLAPHPNRKVRVFLFTVGRHGYFKYARRAISDVAEKKVSIVVHGASRNVVCDPRGMLELGHFLSFERLRIEAPNHPFELLAGPRHRVVFRIAPARSDVVEFSVARERQPAAVVPEHI